MSLLATPNAPLQACDVPLPALNVLVVEDHELMREAIARHLRATAGFDLVETAGSVAEALSVLAQVAHGPGMLLLLDHVLPDGSGMQVLHAAREADPAVKVVMLTGAEQPAIVAQYLSAGADGYVTKTSGSAEMVRIILAVAAGQHTLDSTATRGLLVAFEQTKAAGTRAPLTAREIQVLTLVADGMTNDDIAAALFISDQTVKTHMSHIFDKLGVRDRASATARALRDGLLQ